MKKLFYPLVLSLPLILAGCFGGSAEEITMQFGSERGKLEGSPATMKLSVFDYENAAPGSKGKLTSESYRTYDKDGNVLTYEVKYLDGSDTDYKQVCHYDGDGKMQRYDYQDEEYSYHTVYTWKGKLIIRAQNYYEDEATTYFKYTYKGNREVSRSLYTNLGVKLPQTDYTWDGDRVIKEVEQDLEEGGTTTTRHIEYPDDDTEIIRGEEDGEEFYRITINYNDKGDYRYILSVTDEEESERVYSYEYDATGNWIKRTVATPEGKTLWIENREFTYHS